MIFNGFQKMTLLDFPGKIAATLFTGGCNFRCPFCHNALLVENVDEAEIFSEEQVLSFLSKRKGLLDGIAITGGEPLLHKDIVPFMQKVKDMGFLVKLDTNGTFPSRLREIVSLGLADYVAVDIKNCKEKYAQTVGLPSFNLTPVEETVSFLLSDKVDYEFRTTVVSEFHTVEDIEAAAKWIKGAKRYYLQAFVDSGNLIQSDLHAVSAEIMQEMCKHASLYVPETRLRGI